MQGRYDVVCPMDSAWALHRAWPEADLIISPDAGHSAFDPPNCRALVAADGQVWRLAALVKLRCHPSGAVFRRRAWTESRREPRFIGRARDQALPLSQRNEFRAMNRATVGIDFGTTNSSIALANHSGKVELAHFSELGTATDSYRSLLYLEQVKEGGVNRLKSWSGPTGIEHYLSGDGDGRLMQSLKSFLSSRTLVTTEVFGRRQALVSLIARILRDLREQGEERFGVKINAAIVGRPVQFVGAETGEDNRYAEHRLTEAFREAGFDQWNSSWSRWRQRAITNPRSTTTS